MKDNKFFSYKRILLALIGLTAGLNALACSEAFCNGYTKIVYPCISDVLGWLLGWIPFALGEIIMYAGAIALVLLLILAIPAVLLRKRCEKFANWVRQYAKCCLMAAAVMLLLYTTNWIVPFKSSYIGDGASQKSYTVDQVEELRNFAAEGLVEAVFAVPRDENGYVVTPSKAEREEEVRKVMTAMAGRYPKLRGYYPPIKPAMCSGVLDLMRIGGYTYPFSMELTYNAYYAQNLYFSALYAHESCHHQGYYQEDEADFLSYIGCISSEDPYTRYSGYREFYFVIERVYERTLLEDMSKEDAIERIKAQPVQMPEIVWFDLQHEAEIEKELKENALIKIPEKVASTAVSVGDTGWSVQEKVLKEHYYSGSVALLLDWYFSR